MQELHHTKVQELHFPKVQEIPLVQELHLRNRSHRLTLCGGIPRR